MFTALRYIVAPFIASLVSGFFGLAFAQPITLGGTGSALESLRQIGDEYAKSHPDFQFKVIPSIGSSGAIKGLSTRVVDIGLLARPLNDAELSLGVRATRLAQTPVVMATSRSTEKDITHTQLEAFYSARETRWADNSQVRLVLRPMSETDFQLLSTLSPGMKAALQSAVAREGLLTAATDQEAANGLERLPGSLGTATLSLLLSEKRNLQVLKLNGVAPLVDGKVNPQYPMMKPLYIALHQDARPLARKFAEFLQSPSGKAKLEKFGYTHEFK